MYNFPVSSSGVKFHIASDDRTELTYNRLPAVCFSLQFPSLGELVLLIKLGHGFRSWLVSDNYYCTSFCATREFT